MNFEQNITNSKKGNFFDHPNDMNLTQFDDIDLESFFNLTEPEVVVLRVRPTLTFWQIEVSNLTPKPESGRLSVYLNEIH